ncbi:MAG TPA: hypothetical protein EYP74_01410 [Anaerolineales bacterium]|nr:hypothetical protein [Anaerolineales bacterium]
MRKYRFIYIFLVLFFALSSCAPAPPTLLPIETVFAATHSAIMTRTAKAKPPETATPLTRNTLAPTLTPFPSATTVLLNIVATSTPTVEPSVTPTNITSGSGTVLYACELVSISPKKGYVAKPNEKIKWIWHVRNIGTQKWYPKTMVAKYRSGEPFYVQKEYPMQKITHVGDVAVFDIRAQAPNEPGSYRMTFSLKKGIHYFCYYTLKIIVKK